MQLTGIGGGLGRKENVIGKVNSINNGHTVWDRMDHLTDSEIFRMSGTWKGKKGNI